MFNVEDMLMTVLGPGLISTPHNLNKMKKVIKN